eukprot:632551-Hanusia_phi.AAC.1
MQLVTCGAARNQKFLGRSGRYCWEEQPDSGRWASVPCRVDNVHGPQQAQDQQQQKGTDEEGSDDDDDDVGAVWRKVVPRSKNDLTEDQEEDEGRYISIRESMKLAEKMGY